MVFLLYFLMPLDTVLFVTSKGQIKTSPMVRILQLSICQISAFLYICVIHNKMALQKNIFELCFYKKTDSAISYRERLILVIEQAYQLLRNKIAGKDIQVYNEASMQLHFGSILKRIGELYEFSPTDHFCIELESPEDISPTAKSPNGARCDIKLSFFEGRQSTAKAKAFIELKYFRHSNDTTETITSNRFSVFMDLENLERYQDEKRNENSPKPICYEIVFAENSTYYSPKIKKENNQLNIGEGESNDPSKPIEYRSKKVSLKNKYVFHWDKCTDNQYWLKINI